MSSPNTRPLEPELDLSTGAKEWVVIDIGEGKPAIWLAPKSARDLPSGFTETRQHQSIKDTVCRFFADYLVDDLSNPSTPGVPDWTTRALRIQRLTVDGGRGGDWEWWQAHLSYHDPSGLCSGGDCVGWDTAELAGSKPGSMAESIISVGEPSGKSYYQCNTAETLDFWRARAWEREGEITRGMLMKGLKSNENDIRAFFHWAVPGLDLSASHVEEPVQNEAQSAKSDSPRETLRSREPAYERKRAKDFANGPSFEEPNQMRRSTISTGIYRAGDTLMRPFNDGRYIVLEHAIDCADGLCPPVSKHIQEALVGRRCHQATYLFEPCLSDEARRCVGAQLSRTGDQNSFAGSPGLTSLSNYSTNFYPLADDLVSYVNPNDDGGGAARDDTPGGDSAASGTPKLAGYRMRNL